MECEACGYEKLRVTDPFCPACYVVLPGAGAGTRIGGAALDVSRSRFVRVVALLDILAGGASLVALGLATVLLPILFWAMLRTPQLLLWAAAGALAVVGGTSLRRGRRVGAVVAAGSGLLLIGAAAIDALLWAPAGGGDVLALLAGGVLLLLNAAVLRTTRQRGDSETRLK